MSDAIEKALSDAEAVVESMNEAYKKVKVEVAAQSATIRIAKELTLLRGEMRAIRLLLQESPMLKRSE